MTNDFKNDFQSHGGFKHPAQRQKSWPRNLRKFLFAIALVGMCLSAVIVAKFAAKAVANAAYTVSMYHCGAC